MRGDQRLRGLKRRPDAGKRAPAQRKRDDERADTERADAAVAHDLELALARVAAAKTVGRVGEAVLVQRPGEEKDRSHCDRGRRHRGDLEAHRDPVDEGAAKPDQHADDRRAPDGAAEIGAADRHRLAHRHAGIEGDAGPQLGQKVADLQVRHVFAQLLLRRHVPL